jgi:hypothetical protein
MAYAHTTLAAAVAAVAARLGDPSLSFWSSGELRALLYEGLRLWQAATDSSRERGALPTQANVAFYDLGAELPTLLGNVVTDRNVVAELEAHLLEPVTPTGWTGSTQFTLPDLVAALQRRRDQFLLETGTILTHGTLPISAPPAGRVTIPDSYIDVRRLAWRSVEGVYKHLWREDEHGLSAFLPTWSIEPATPRAFSVSAARPFELQLAPPPLDEGALDVVSVQTGAALDPVAGVLLGVPDDYAWVVKWGTLADLLGRQGESRDAARAAYCEARWKSGISLAKIAQSVIHAQIGGRPLWINSILDLDAMLPNWQNDTGEPRAIGSAGENLVCLANVPDGVYGLTVDVIRNAPIPAHDGAFLQVGREHLDVIIGYAEHVATFKMGGEEFQSTMPLLTQFFDLAGIVNKKLRASGGFEDIMTSRQTKEQKQRPRQSDDAKKIMESVSE